MTPEAQLLPPENAAIPATSAIDFDALTDDERSYIISSGGELPPSVVAKQTAAQEPEEAPKIDEPEKDEPEVKEPDKEDEEAEPAEKPVEKKDEEEPAEGDEGVVDAELEARVANFKFTENADEETRAKEEAEYLELIDLPEPVQQMIAARDTRIAALAETTVETDQVTHQTMDAFNQMLNYKQNEDGEWVYDTEGVIGLFNQVYPKEFKQFTYDSLMLPSAKYSGFNFLQEIIRDGFGLPTDAISRLQTYFDSGGRDGIPTYVPAGVDPRVAEAYWRTDTADRDELFERVDRWVKVLDDEYASEEEHDRASMELERVNRQLGAIQKGLDADNQKAQSEIEKTRSYQFEVDQQGAWNYTQTTRTLLQQGAAEMEVAMPFDTPGAKLTSFGVAVAVNMAFSDNDDYAKDAQKVLTDAGVKVNWAQAKTITQKLWAAEKRIAALDKMGDQVNPRSLDLARKNKKEILLELKGFEKNVVGNVNRILANGAGTALKTKIATAGKVPVVRPKIKGAGTPQPTKIDFNAMPHEELKEIVFGNKPLPTEVGS